MIVYKVLKGNEVVEKLEDPLSNSVVEMYSIECKSSKSVRPLCRRPVKIIIIIIPPSMGERIALENIETFKVLNVEDLIFAE